MTRACTASYKQQVEQYRYSKVDCSLAELALMCAALFGSRFDERQAPPGSHLSEL